MLYETKQRQHLVVCHTGTTQGDANILPPHWSQCQLIDEGWCAYKVSMQGVRCATTWLRGMFHLEPAVLLTVIGGLEAFLIGVVSACLSSAHSCSPLSI